MRKIIVGVGSLVAAAATLLMVGGIAGASPSAATPVTGPEVVFGAVHGKAATANTPHIPLILTGVVNTTDRGFVLGNGGGKRHTLVTKAGHLSVRTKGKQQQSESVNARTCRVTFIVRQQFTFAPGLSTGRFAGATGPGSYQVTFSAFVPRHAKGKHKGECNVNAQPLNKGAVAIFLAAGTITLP
jgi:hypothetical protein